MQLEVLVLSTCVWLVQICWWREGEIKLPSTLFISVSQLLSVYVLSSVTPQHQQRTKLHLFSPEIWSTSVHTIWMTFLSDVGYTLKFFICNNFVLRADIVLWLFLALDAILGGNGANGNMLWAFLMTFQWIAVFWIGFSLLGAVQK